MNKTLEELLGGPPVTDEEKILFWMRMAKERGAILSSLQYRAQEVVDAYEHRFGSISGSYLGPIDEEVKLLAQELKAIPK